MIYDYQSLLKDQKNELFRIVRDEGFDPSDFEWVGAEGRRGGRDYEISVLMYKDSPYFYKFDVVRDGYLCERCPGDKTTADRDDEKIWENVVPDFLEWLRRLKSEIDTPDLWVEAQKYQSVFHMPLEGQTLDIPFSYSEAEQIAGALKQVEERIIEAFKPTNEQLKFIQYKLSYLESVAKKPYGRIDWLHILIGVLTTIAVSLALSPEQANQIFVYFKEALGSIIPLLK